MKCYVFGKRSRVGRVHLAQHRQRRGRSTCRSRAAGTASATGSSRTTSATTRPSPSPPTKGGTSTSRGISKAACRRSSKRGSPACSRSCSFPSDLPRWDLSLNPNRALGLRNAHRGQRPLAAGEAGPHARRRRRATPGRQDRGVLRAELGVRAVPLGVRRTALPPGVQEAARRHRRRQRVRPDRHAAPRQARWAPHSVKPMLEHYLGKPLAEVEKEYREFIRRSPTNSSAGSG